MSLELPYGYKNLDPDGSSNVDDSYGYYNSLVDAYAAVPMAMRKGGRTVGIKQADGSIIEYWWENDNDLTNAGLVVKTAGGGGTFDPSEYDLDEFNNASADPYIKDSELGDVAKSNDYNDLDNLPDLSAFDNVDTYPTVGDFPAVGEADVFYIDDSTGKLYRWAGSNYAVVSGGLTLGETSQTAYRGDRGKIAYDHSQAAHAPADAQKNSDITQTEITNSLGYIPENLERKVSNLLFPDDFDYPTTKAVADAIAENYLTLNPSREIDLSNQFINKYNFDNPIDAVTFLTVNSQVGGKAIVRVNTNTASNPAIVTINGSTSGRICGIENWEDNVDMEIYLDYTVNGLEWWYYTKER